MWGKGLAMTRSLGHFHGGGQGLSSDHPTTCVFDVCTKKPETTNPNPKEATSHQVSKTDRLTHTLHPTRASVFFFSGTRRGTNKSHPSHSTTLPSPSTGRHWVNRIGWSRCDLGRVHVTCHAQPSSHIHHLRPVRSERARTEEQCGR